MRAGFKRWWLVLPVIADVFFPATGWAVPYLPGEKTSFSITYFGATAGILDLEVAPGPKEGGKALTDLVAKARTDSIFAIFYRLQNLYRSTTDLNGVPLRFVITHDETKYGGTVTQEFDQAKKKVKHADRRIDRKKDDARIERDVTKEILAGTHDVVSMFFHVRALPLAKGKSYDVPVFIGEDSHVLRLDVVGEEDLSTKIGEMPSFVVKPSVLKDGQAKEVPETFLWIAKDKNRALLKIKAKVKIGSVVAYLRSYTPGR